MDIYVKQPESKGQLFIFWYRSYTGSYVKLHVIDFSQT